MKRKIILSLLAVLFIMGMACRSAYAAGDVLDAHTWVSWQYEEKRKFVLGFLEGERVTRKIMTPLINKIKDEELRKAMWNTLDSISTRDYAVKVVDRVESFYMKSSNRNVSMGVACAKVISDM